MFPRISNSFLVSLHQQMSICMGKSERSSIHGLKTHGFRTPWTLLTQIILSQPNTDVTNKWNNQHPLLLIFPLALQHRISLEFSVLLMYWFYLPNTVPLPSPQSTFTSCWGSKVPHGDKKQKALDQATGLAPIHAPHVSLCTSSTNRPQFLHI